MGILDTSRQGIEFGGVRTDDRIEPSLSLSDVLDRIVEIQSFPTRENTIFLEIELGTPVSSGWTQKPPSLPSKMAQCRYKGYFVIEGFLFSRLFVCHGEYDSETSCVSGIILVQHYFYPISWSIVSFPCKQALWGSVFGPKQGFETKYIQDYGVVFNSVSGEAVKIRHKIDVKGGGYM